MELLNRQPKRLGGYAFQVDHSLGHNHVVAVVLLQAGAWCETWAGWSPNQPMEILAACPYQWWQLGHGLDQVGTMWIDECHGGRDARLPGCPWASPGMPAGGLPQAGQCWTRSNQRYAEAHAAEGDLWLRKRTPSACGETQLWGRRKWPLLSYVGGDLVVHAVSMAGSLLLSAGTGAHRFGQVLDDGLMLVEVFAVPMSAGSSQTLLPVISPCRSWHVCGSSSASKLRRAVPPCTSLVQGPTGRILGWRCGCRGRSLWQQNDIPQAGWRRGLVLCWDAAWGKGLQFRPVWAGLQAQAVENEVLLLDPGYCGQCSFVDCRPGW